ncbi:MAG: glycosyltransferase family 1 protein, partial [Nostocoides sp.]
MTTVHVVVPEGVADPSRPSGGNTYGRRVCAALDARGWSVVVHEAPGQWPHANPAAHLALGRTLAQLSDDALVLLDGLVASSVPHVLAPEQRRLRQVVVVHLPLGVSVGGGMAAGSPEAGRTPAETPGMTPG